MGASRGPKLSVVNVGIGGNRLHTDESGPSAVKRLARDVLAQSGRRGLIMLEGINDLSNLTAEDPELPSLRQMATAYSNIIRRPTPFGHFATPEQVERRHEINRWICVEMRSQGPPGVSSVVPSMLGPAVQKTARLA